MRKYVVRTLTNPKNEPRTSQARTPHHLLNGTITPNGLHFVVSRTGFPDIDPDKHRLVIHGLVKQPLVFTLEALARYPMVSRINFVECGGNSAPLYNKDPVQANVQAIHGLVSCSEWTGVRLSTLLEETGIDPKAKWLLAEGADGPSMNRSIPIAKALDDAMIALYQNGERIAPSNGYPMRLLVPGYEGNMNVKWLHRIKLVEAPVMAINETMQYTYRVAGPKIWQFFFPMEVKSFITHPSPGLTLKEPGYYEISGLAYSGNGRIAKVMVSADGGKSWGEAALDAPVFEQGVDQVPHALALGRPAGGSAKSRLGRSRQYTADPRRDVCRARRAQGERPGDCVPDGTHERHHELGHRRQRGDQACICVRFWLVAVPLGLMVGAATAIAADRPGLGKPVTEADLALWDISVAPDGAGLPSGSGTPAQGAIVYAQKCELCHGKEGPRGRSMPRSSGPQRTVANYVPHATTIFDFTRRAMPWQQPKSLTNDEVYAVTAYILSLNKIIGDNEVMSAESLPNVQMPNRDGFVSRYPEKH